MVDGGLTFEEVYVNPQELRRQLQQGKAGQPALPAPPAADGTVHRQRPGAGLPVAADCRRSPQPAQQPELSRAVHDLHQGLAAGGGHFRQPLGLLSDLDLRGRRALPARKAIRARLPAVQRGPVPGGGEPGLLLRLPAGVEVPVQLQQLAGRSTPSRGSTNGWASC